MRSCNKSWRTSRQPSATFQIRPIAQKESDRLTSGRPWSVTTSGDHSFPLESFNSRTASRLPANRGALPHRATIYGYESEQHQSSTVDRREAGAAPAVSATFRSCGEVESHVPAKDEPRVRLSAGTPFSAEGRAPARSPYETHAEETGERTGAHPSANFHRDVA